MDSASARRCTNCAKRSGARITDAAGRTLLTPPRGARFGLVTRAHLQEVLLDALIAEPSIRCRFGTTLERVHADGTAVLTQGETTSTEQFDLVIGADGVHSRVRDGGDFGARVQRTGVHYLRALVPVTISEGTEAWTREGLFGAVPVAGGTYCYASCGTPRLKQAIAMRDLTLLRSAWHDAYPHGARLLDSVADWDALLLHEVVRVTCVRWHDQRLVLVGDAAHAMAPNLGQGANSALVDAAVLVDALASAPDLSQGLASYAARRQAKVRRVADTAARLGRLAELVHPFARMLRDRVLLPVLALLPTDRQLAVLLQEDPEALMRMGLERTAVGVGV